MLSDIVSENQQLVSFTSEGPTVSVRDTPPAIYTFFAQVFKEILHKPMQTGARVQLKPVCSVERSVGNKPTISAFSTVVYKDLVWNQTILIELFFVQCCVFTIEKRDVSCPPLCN